MLPENLGSNIRSDSDIWSILLERTQDVTWEVTVTLECLTGENLGSDMESDSCSNSSILEWECLVSTIT